ncbi:MAG TPA: type II secretion system protein N [Steroidobacteraceae bacterium]|nr:type II secretion system protein N [Steroidobacteraceae bacterium]
MPTSPSPRRAIKGAARAAPAAPKPHALWPRIALIGLLAALGVAIAVLPASLASRVLPSGVQATDFSGTLWHGSAGRIMAGGRDAGALEWHLHPGALLRLRVAADLHWVKGGFDIDGAADLGHGDLTLTAVQGGGPISDLRDLGVAAGWRGLASVRLQTLSADLSPKGLVLRSAVGEVDVADASSPQIAAGADLGSYALSFADPSLPPDGEIAATLVDTGGPLSLNATITVSPQARTGLLSGSIKERADAPPALRRDLDNVAQLHARDPQGRIPVDLEFTF